MNDGLELYQEYQGGILFYFLQEGDLGYVPGETHGLIASFEDLSTSEGEFEVPWGCCPDEYPFDDCIDISGAENEAIGAGLQNTHAILEACQEVNIAARLCDAYSIEYEGVVYDDWYLPSFMEIQKMNRPKDYILDHSVYYWTSSQDATLNNSNKIAIEVFGWVDQCWEPYDPRDPEGCWHVGSFLGSPKYQKLRVRAVRSF
ncbi:DUF1566 domain-containing protein [Croceivirga sp. JEA036]|uniref:DUF1566 domain-containing protein n=1 Tax=Croceivirga sp. JEA036 TaxID=2721162 RepID=UPI00143879A9|nr:DUF1566 domain-containing protein [Croceivirga sp. JEA036]NJB37080.1 DUF1566 domain-containing protein [Croceivirga sp. JEA036]